MISSCLLSSFFKTSIWLFNVSYSPSNFTSFDLKSMIYSFKDFSILAKCSSLYLFSSSLSFTRFYIFLFKFFSWSSAFFFCFASYLDRFSIFIVLSSTYSFNFLSCLSINWVFSFRLDNTPLVLDRSNSLLFARSLISLFFESSINSRALFKLLISVILYPSYLS